MLTGMLYALCFISMRYNNTKCIPIIIFYIIIQSKKFLVVLFQPLYSIKYKTSLACPQNMYGELQRCPLLYFKGIDQIYD
jgi:hypothetical protein